MDINIGSPSGGAPEWLTWAAGLGGVLVGGVVTWILQATQRRHDRAEKTRDRLLQLRREVYVQAMEDHSNAMVCLATKPSITDAAFNEATRKFLGSLQKVQLVGTGATVLACTELQRRFLLLDVEHASTVGDVRGANAGYESAVQSLAELHEDLVKTDRQMRGYASQPGLSGAAKDAADEYHQIEDAIADTVRIRDEWAAKRSQAQIAFSERLQPSAAPIKAAALHWMNCIRLDLSLDALDADTIEAIVSQNRKAADAALNTARGLDERTTGRRS
jgi:hypothetical protein